MLDGKYVLFGNLNEMIVESYGDRRLYILEGEVVRHNYTWSESWEGHGILSDLTIIKNMRWLW
jgi:hypothetical protein